MPWCVVKHCRNDSNKPNCREGISFHRFPKYENLKNSWIKIIRESRQEEQWCPTLKSVVCSIHFNTEDKYTTKNGVHLLHRHAVPSQNLMDPGKIKLERDPLSESESISNTDHVPETDHVPKTNNIPGRLPESNPLLILNPFSALHTLPVLKPLPALTRLPALNPLPAPKPLPELGPLSEIDPLPELYPLPELDSLPELNSLPELSLLLETNPFSEFEKEYEDFDVLAEIEKEIIDFEPAFSPIDFMSEPQLSDVEKLEAQLRKEMKRFNDMKMLMKRKYKILEQKEQHLMKANIALKGKLKQRRAILY